MRSKKLSRKFFNRPTLIVAKELLGKFLVRKTIAGNKPIAVMIRETEAYCGSDDLANHGSRGRTKRTETMFGPAGYAYIYLIYGMYYCLNVVTEKANYPAAVLIRAAEQTEVKNLTPKTYNLKPALDGPGKLCRFLKINRSLNGEDVIKSKKLWFEDRGIRLKPSQIKRSPRIGVNYAGKYENKLWRFHLPHSR